MVSPSYWCQLALLGGEAADEGVLIEVEGERIASVEVDVAAPSEATRLDGLTIPGLANAHSHAFQRALRGRTHRGRGDFWAWREAMYELASRLDPDSYLALARATYGEMALAGITCVGEFHYLHHTPDGTPYADPNAMGHSLMQAAREAGIRITLIDACYLHGGIGEKLAGAQLRFGDGDAEAWAERVMELTGNPGARIGAAIHSIRAVDPESAATVAGWAGAREAPLHAHVSEQPAENEASRRAYGATPTAVLADAGALDERFTGIHGTHLTDPDVRLLGRARTTCCVCPTTERDLADGIATAERFRAAGIELALGSDSHAVIDLFEETRAVELDERLASGERGHIAASELLGAATESGHACLGWPEAGRIEPGAIADLVTMGIDTPRLAGADRRDAADAVVFGATAADVRSVIVSGREVVRDGAHVVLDVPAELASAIEAVWS
ncbi:MAG: formimidoylglutamate deiminase [Actinobacteria bacterium]|nr:MAG: formimidoylglutamate deiminase [Actinomycetota bacterium]